MRLLTPLTLFFFSSIQLLACGISSAAEPPAPEPIPPSSLNIGNITTLPADTSTLPQAPLFKPTASPTVASTPPPPPIPVAPAFPPPPPQSRSQAWIEPPFAPVALDANLFIGEKLSLVELTVLYNYLQVLDPDRPAEVYFHLPIFVSDPTASLETNSLVTDLQLIVEGKSFAPSYQIPVPNSDLPIEFDTAPENATLVIFTFKVPRFLLRERTAITYKYVQPHYTNNRRIITACYPELPYQTRFQKQLRLAPSDFTVTFRLLPKTPCTLKLVSGSKLTEDPTPARIQVRPQNHQNIAVQLLPIPPTTSPQSPATQPAKP